MAESRAVKYYGNSPKIVADENGNKMVQKAPLTKPQEPADKEAAAKKEE